MKKIAHIISIMFFTLLFLLDTNRVLATENIEIYDGHLGIQYEESKTTFTIWSSNASKIYLNLEDQSIELEKMYDNVWQKEVSGDLLNQTYTYTIDYGNGELYENVLDPYGKFLNQAGNKNVVYDGNLIEFEEWTNQINYLQIENVNKIIYSIDVKLFTQSIHWNGSNNYRSKLLGLVEENTKYNGNSTGFDHIKSLGITYVELDNLFDEKSLFAVNDSYVVGTDSYSGNLEMKTMVNKFYQNGIGVIATIDLYNFSNNFLFNLKNIDKEYYLTNEQTIDYDKYMVQRYISDLLMYIVEEYKLSGIKFENMSKINLGLINLLSSKLKKINPNIVIYGDGSYDTPNVNTAGENNISKLNGISMINKSLSYGLLGNLNDYSSKGVLANNFSTDTVESIKFTLISGVQKENLIYGEVGGISYKNYWETENSFQLVNYISLSNGLSIHDKLYLSGITSNSEIIDKMVMAYGTLMVSGGIPHITSGEEFLISYNANSEENAICNIEKSTCFYTNDNKKQIDWSYTIRNESVINAIKSLINFRKNNYSIIQTNKQFLQSNVNIYENKETPGVIGYSRIYPNARVNNTQKINVLFNYSGTDYSINAISGKNWKGVYNYNGSNREDNILNLMGNSIYMEYQTKKPKVSPWITLILVVGIIGGIYWLNITLSKRLVSQGHDIKEVKRKYRPFVKSELSRNNQEQKENIDEEKDKE